MLSTVCSAKVTHVYNLGVTILTTVISFCKRVNGLNKLVHDLRVQITVEW